MTSLDGSNFLDELAGLLQVDGFGSPSSAGRTSAPDADGGSGDAGYAGMDGLDLSGFASLGRSLAGLSAASSHAAGSDLPSDALAAGFSLGAAPSGLSEVGRVDALSLDAAALKVAAADVDPGRSALPDASHAGAASAFAASDLSDFHAFGRSAVPAGAGSTDPASTVSDFHAFGRSATPFGASAGSFGSAGTDASGASAEAKALSNLDAADTFHFVSDYGKVPVWSGPQGDAHYDPAGHVTFDDLLGADHAVLTDYGTAFDGLHADPLKDVAHASQHGDDFHTA